MRPLVWKANDGTGWIGDCGVKRADGTYCSYMHQDVTLPAVADDLRHHVDRAHPPAVEQ